MNRANQLQFLRFLAFGFILMHHLSAWLWDSFPGPEGAYFAVSFFFILSGFVLAYSSFDKEVCLSWTDEKNHIWKKLKKLYPLYFCTTIFTVVYSGIPGFVAEHNYNEAGKEIVQLLKNLFLIQSWFKEGYFSFNGVGWFLSTIIVFYLLDLPLLKLFNKIRQSNKRVVIYVLIIIGSLLLLSVYSLIFKDIDRKFMLYITPCGRIWEYVIGISLGYIVKDVQDIIPENKGSLITFSILEVLSLLFAFCLMYHKISKWHTFTLKWVLPNILIILIFGFGLGILSQIFKKKLFVSLGDISFECYLIHQVIVKAYGELYGYKTSGGVNNLFVVSFVFFTTLIFAFLLHGRVEKRTR